MSFSPIEQRSTDLADAVMALAAVEAIKDNLWRVTGNQPVSQEQITPERVADFVLDTTRAIQDPRRRADVRSRVKT